MNKIYINTKLLLLSAICFIGVFYYFLFPYDKIIQIIKDQYIILLLVVFLFLVYIFQNIKLKEFDILHFLPNIHHVPLKSTILLFLVFEIIDFYSEDGFMGMVSLWFMYWCFGVLAYLLSLNINLYKNLRLYKYNKQNEKDL